MKISKARQPARLTDNLVAARRSEAVRAWVEERAVIGDGAAPRLEGKSATRPGRRPKGCLIGA